MAVSSKNLLHRQFVRFLSSHVTAGWTNPSKQSLGHGTWPLEAPRGLDRVQSHVRCFNPSVPTCPRRHLNFLSVFSREAVAREKERLKDELNRGYFDDFKELKVTGGKMGAASQTLLPVASAVQFPSLIGRTTEGATVVLPPQQPQSSSNDRSPPGDTRSKAGVAAALVCITFRASGQPMVESWSRPFLAQFGAMEDIQLVEVSVIESAVLSLPPVRELLLRSMRRRAPPPPPPDAPALERAPQAVYVFGDQWDARKVLGMTNRLTAYALLVDERGRVRWRASGYATDEEVKALITCTQQLLRQQNHQSKALLT